MGTPPNHDPADSPPAPPPGDATGDVAPGAANGSPEPGAANGSPDPSAANGSPEPPAAAEVAVASASAAPAPDQSAQFASPPALQPTAAAIPAEPNGWLGRVIDDRYRIVRLLGEGGMGAVYVAEHLTLHKPVALKVVRAELAGNGEVAARFAREAMATAQFEHPHVASAIDYGTLPEGGAYLVMQLVRGRSLRHLVSGGKRLPWRRACEIAAQVSDALSAAKAVGIIHRDLKPDNILVERREDGSDLVKVLDFGIAHVAPRDAASPGATAHRELTRVGTVMGTPGYMSPEQAVGDKVDHRTDLYALGVVLWESITGSELWDAPDLTTVVTRQLTETVPKLRERVDDNSLPPELDELLQRLTARNLTERPEHAAEVRDTLRRLASEATPPIVAARAMAALHSLRDSSIGPFVQQAVERYSAQPKQVQRLLAGGAALGLLALVLVVVPGGDDTQAAAPKQQANAAQPATTGKQPERSVIDKMVDAVKKATPLPKPKPLYPDELEDDVQTMLEGEGYRARRRAAEKVLAYEPKDEVAAHLRVIAQLETSRGCKPRKEAIAKMKEQRDPRYLPSLQRYAQTSRSGCGFLNLSDCYGCIRGDLHEAIDAIQQRLPQPGSAMPGAKPQMPNRGM